MHNFVVAHTKSQQTPRATHLLTCGMSQPAVCSNSEAAGNPAQQKPFQHNMYYQNIYIGTGEYSTSTNGA
jgi:hypothetical protein